MIRLLLRILSWMYLTLLAAMTVQFFVLGLFYGRFFADPDWYPVRHTAALVQKILDSTPVDELQPESQWLQATLNRQIDITAAGEADISDAVRKELPEGLPVYDGDGMFHMPLHDGAFLARMSPSFHQYKPLLKPAAVLIFCLIMGIVAAIVGFFMTRPLARRLKALETAAERIRQGDIQTRVRSTPSDLIGNVGRCFNQMAEQIQLLVMIRQQLLSAIARKFQSPVKEIGRRLESLSTTPGTDGIEDGVHKIDESVNDIEQMVTGLLLNEKRQRSEFERPCGAPGPKEREETAQSRFHKGVMKFITRMCLGILIVLLLHQLFMVGVSQLAYKHLNTDPAWYPARTMAALITRTVEKTDKEALPALLDSLSETLHRRIDLLSAEAGKSIIYNDPRKFAGEMTYGDYNGQDVFCAPVLDATRSLLIDPGYSQYRRKPSILFHSFFLTFGFLLTTLFGIFLSMPIIRNLKKLEEGIEKIRMGDLSTRVDIPQGRPTGPLAGCLNHMVQRIQSLLEHQKHLIQAIAHEIRTPASRIRFHLEMLTDARSGEERSRLVADIGGEIEELNLLVSELVTFSSLDALTEKVETAPVSLHEFLAEIVAYHRKTHGHVEIALQDAVEENLTINVNPVHFKRAIQNILSNALRHARKKVVLQCSMEKEGIRIDVLDDGPGVPAESRETVLQPFTRLDDSRSRNSGGFGLGLAIVDRIVSLHGGTVSIDDNAPAGTRVTTFWPDPAMP